jgi:hypothetical protein
MEVHSQLHSPLALSLERDSGTHWMGDFVFCRVGLDAVEKKILCPCQRSNPHSSVVEFIVTILTEFPCYNAPLSSPARIAGIAFADPMLGTTELMCTL